MDGSLARCFGNPQDTNMRSFMFYKIYQKKTSTHLRQTISWKCHEELKSETNSIVAELFKKGKSNVQRECSVQSSLSEDHWIENNSISSF